MYLKTLSNLTYSFEILPFLFCLIFYKKINTRALKVFFIYTLLLSFFIFINYYLLYIRESKDHVKEYYLINVRTYVITEYILLALFFFCTIKSKIPKNIILFSALPFTIFCILNYFSSDPLVFNNKTLLAEFSLFIIVIVYFFFEKMRIVTRIPLYQSITFWLCVGLFIYFTGNFFYLLFTSTATDLKFKAQMHIIYSIVTITKDIILSLAWFAFEQKVTIEDELRIPKDLHLDDDLSFTLPTNP